MIKKNKIIINHLYSRNLNLYGDLGNIKTLCFRLEKRNIPYELVHNEVGDNKLIKSDIYFIGGGQDNDQLLVFNHLLKHKDFIQNEVINNKVFILICGGYQLFGKFFLDAHGRTIDGLNILDIETKSLGPNVKLRCIGDLIVELDDEFIKHWNVDVSFSRFIVGFENHGGQTYFLNTQTKFIGKVVKGYGNNYMEKQEGGWKNNIIGTYLHGPFLPKNFHIADAIIKKALRTDFLKELDNEIEKKAHKSILKKYKIISN